MSSTRMLRLAAIAAVLASLGDLLLLYFANAQRPELGLPAIGSVWLLGGGVLGALAIPFYGLGYRAASRLLTEPGPASARVITVAGVAIGLIGGLIHALTALYIGESAPAAANADPIASIVASGPLLP
ncbi:MAG: hypothetical protein OEV20_06680, partial [Actinomycetota bacterium]|nr:hypothetical protein [Actinomycetota bacterium]